MLRPHHPNRAAAFPARYLSPSIWSLRPCRFTRTPSAPASSRPADLSDVVHARRRMISPPAAHVSYSIVHYPIYTAGTGHSQCDAQNLWR